ncbi:MAG: DUF4065 domain-containing protein [Rickettsiales bacterium]|nr:DUF4065 domain-containing protein [Rickettsiales bacterium]
MYSPAKIANSIIRIARSYKINLDPLKLQKIIYFAHCKSLLERNQILITEPFHAFSFGPLITSIYHEYKKYGNNPVDHYTSELVMEENDLTWKILYVPDDDVETNKILNETFDKYSNYSGSILAEMTHIQNGPWFKTYAQGLKEGINNGKEISNYEIRNHTARQVDEFTNRPANLN